MAGQYICFVQCKAQYWRMNGEVLMNGALGVAGGGFRWTQVSPV